MRFVLRDERGFTTTLNVEMHLEAAMNTALRGIGPAANLYRDVRSHAAFVCHTGCLPLSSVDAEQETLELSWPEYLQDKPCGTLYFFEHVHGYTLRDPQTGAAVEVSRDNIVQHLAQFSWAAKPVQWNVYHTIQVVRDPDGVWHQVGPTITMRCESDEAASEAMFDATAAEWQCVGRAWLTRQAVEIEYGWCEAVDASNTEPIAHIV